MSDWRAQAQAWWDRQQQTRAEPYGTWTQRWVPGRCPHDDVRCIHGDEIIVRNFRRRKCRRCGRALRGDLPLVCWFSGRPHAGVTR